jgi:glycosyltransferase involved in cell wall biosynthesis
VPVRSAVLAPFTFPSVRGNAITVDRIVRGLREGGVDVRVWDLSSTPEATIESEVEDYRPNLIHAFHAFRVGPLALRIARRAEIPLVVTLTGTDANHDLFDPERASIVRRVLEGARSLTVFHASIAERVSRALPDLRARLIEIPQSVRMDVRNDFDLGSRWALPSTRCLFVFPAGIRMVKNPTMPLAPLDRLVRRHADVRLLYVGPILNAEEGEALSGALQDRPWARHVGAVPHEQMASLLAQADVVLNCSISEGGMANSVLEALVMGRAVLASDIEGNRPLIQNGVTGLLFRDADELEARAEQLVRDPALRQRLGAAGRDLVQRLYPPERELDGYFGVYSGLVPVPSA